MSTLVVEVSRIEKVLPHGNADALELAQIKGWQCVVPKGRYRVDDLVTYIPIDAVASGGQHLLAATGRERGAGPAGAFGTECPSSHSLR